MRQFAVRNRVTPRPAALHLAVNIALPEDATTGQLLSSAQTSSARTLSKLAENHPCIGDVLGIGGLWTVEPMRNRQTKEPLVPLGATGEANAPMAAVTKTCLDRGLLLLMLGNRIHAAPPLNVNDSDVASGLGILDEALAEADTFLA
jgi:taurine---2-oxoglutarate transaminase